MSDSILYLGAPRRIVERCGIIHMRSHLNPDATTPVEFLIVELGSGRFGVLSMAAGGEHTRLVGGESTSLYEARSAMQRIRDTNDEETSRIAAAIFRASGYRTG